MKLQTLMILKILLRHVQDHSRLPAVYVSKHSCVWCVRVCVQCVCVALVTCACSVVCVPCAWWCLVWCVRCVWRGLARGKPPVCTFKTPPCVPAKRAHVFNMRAFCQYTRRRFQPTHERRERERGGEGGFSSLSFSLPFSFSLFPLLSSLSSLSATMTMITRPVGLSLCTHGSNLPECQSACILAHSVFGEHVHIMQETTVQA